jgi:chloramphenicol 3-O-phosphotransferase
VAWVGATLRAAVLCTRSCNVVVLGSMAAVEIGIERKIRFSERRSGFVGLWPMCATKRKESDDQNYQRIVMAE